MGDDRTSGAGGRIGRRALLAVGALGVCGAGVVAAPYVAQRVQDAERALVLAELEQIEGVSIDAAIQAAELTRIAVQTIVLPVARFVALVGGDALGLLLSAIDGARAALKVVGASSAMLDQFRVVVASWQTSVTSLPITLNNLANADIQSAESYLKTLKHMIQSQQASQIHL